MSNTSDDTRSASATTVKRVQCAEQTPSREEAEEAVRTILRWVGDDPEREGLHDTPARVVRAWEEYASGYAQDPSEILSRTFEEVEGYNDIILLRDIPLESHCEHHLAPIIGRVHVAYLPDRRVVGISKLARLVDVYAKRLQVQEKMTNQIASVIEEILRPKGVGVVIDAVHHCMSTRGVHKHGVSMVTSTMRGIFLKSTETRRELLSLIGMHNTTG